MGDQIKQIITRKPCFMQPGKVVPKTPLVTFNAAQVVLMAAMDALNLKANKCQAEMLDNLTSRQVFEHANLAKSINLKQTHNKSSHMIKRAKKYKKVHPLCVFFDRYSNNFKRSSARTIYFCQLLKLCFSDRCILRCQGLEVN